MKLQTNNFSCSIIIFDSLGGNHRPAMDLIQKYLRQEARERKKMKLKEDPHKIHAKVPRQPNHCDCGVFLLQFFEDFMMDPEGKLKLIFVIINANILGQKGRRM